MRTILVIANETLGGAKLFDTVREKVGSDDDARVVVCVPRNRPKHGNVIYDDAVFDAARVRIDLARGYMREHGINAIGEVGDPDPYTAAMDAIADHEPDEIIVSTLPVTSSGWLRRDLIERIEDASGLPVTHVVVDIDTEGLPFDVTLIVANRTAGREELLDAMKAKTAGERERLFVICVPQEGGDGNAAAKARGRLSQVVDRARAAGLVCAGMIGDPDPYTATMNALQFFRVEDVIISTLPTTRSGWMRANLIERVKRASGKPVEHVEARPSTSAEASAA
jgi:hypothetical protein